MFAHICCWGEIECTVTRVACQFAHRARVTRVAFAGQDLVASSSDDGSIRFWDRTTGMEKEGAVPGSVLGWSDCREQRVGRFRVAAEDDLLTICLAAEGGAGKARKAAPVAFFRAPSRIGALVCTGADIALGCDSGAVLQQQAEVLLT